MTLFFEKLFNEINQDGQMVWKIAMLFHFGKCKCLHTGHGNTGTNYDMWETILCKTMKEKDSGGGGGVTINANMKVLDPSRIAMSNSNQTLGMITYKEKDAIDWSNITKYFITDKQHISFCKI